MKETFPTTCSIPRIALSLTPLHQVKVCKTIHVHFVQYQNQDSSVGTAIRHAPDGPGIESRRGLDFPHHFRSALGPTQPPVQRVPRLLPGSKGDWGVALTTHPHLAPRLNKESYTPTPLWASMTTSKVNFTFYRSKRFHSLPF